MAEDEAAIVRIEDVIPECPICGPHRVESHPMMEIVRCANCKEWLAV